MRPIQRYYRQTRQAAFVGTMAADSNSRQQAYLSHGCYLDHISIPRCTPLAFWREADIWEYLHTRDIPYCSIYDTGVKHTGCMFCMFGIANEASPNRFELMSRTHPQIHAYCMEELGLRRVLTYIGYPTGCVGSTAVGPPASISPDRLLLSSVSS